MIQAKLSSNLQSFLSKRVEPTFITIRFALVKDAILMTLALPRHLELFPYRLQYELL